MTQLNQNTCRPRQALDDISRKYPGLWKNIDETRALRGKKLKTWPEICFIPASIIDSIFYRNSINYCVPNTEYDTSAEIARLSALAAWRVTQGIYRFDADIYEAVRNTPIEGDFPWKVLCHIPEWCIYIETPNLSIGNEIIYGVWMHIDWEAEREFGILCILLDSKQAFPIILHLNEEPVQKQFEDIAMASFPEGGVDSQSATDFYLALVALLTSLLSLGIFICTQAAEIGSGEERPANPTPKRIKGGEFRLFPPNCVATWKVGVRMGAALRQAHQRATVGKEGEEGLRNSPRGHIRRAHWHTVVSGPRKMENGTSLATSQRKLEVRWQPPLAINLPDANELPATIRVVGSGSRTSLPEPFGVLACQPASPAIYFADPRRA